MRAQEYTGRKNEYDKFSRTGSCQDKYLERRSTQGVWGVNGSNIKTLSLLEPIPDEEKYRPLNGDAEVVSEG